MRYKIYWLLYSEFLQPFSLASREKTDPYFREEESSEASGKQRLNEYTAHD